MAYSGSTAASSVANPPILIARGGIGQSNRSATALSTAVPGVKQGSGLWFYSSTNSSTQAQDSNFFSDAWYLGMRPGDCVYGIYYSSAGSSIVTYFGGISAVTTDGASLSTGGTITSTFN
jgi:hypothetical protein